MSLKISIVTCTYNSAQYLQKSIDSVLAQDYGNIEYIFVDGGSVDGTLDIIKSAPIPYQLVGGVNTGISAAMNKGIEMATGDVVAHLHSDDYYLDPSMLRTVADAFTETGCEWLFGRIMTDLEGNLKPEGYVVPRYSYKRILKGNFIPHPATFVRKRLFDRVGYFNPGFKYAMDYDMWLRLGRIADPVQLDRHLAAFRQHAGSLSSANKLAALKDDFDVRRQYMGTSPFAYTYHLAHYLVRRSRARRQMAGS